MTAEGTFPKSDGDILYASEVNRFGTGYHWLCGGSAGAPFINPGSATASTNLGSFVIAAGSLTPIAMLKCFYATSSVGTNGVDGTLTVTLSGANFGASKSLTINGEGVLTGIEDWLLGGGGMGIGVGQESAGNEIVHSSTDGNFTSYPNSGLWIIVNLQHNNTGSATVEQFHAYGANI